MYNNSSEDNGTRRTWEQPTLDRGPSKLCDADPNRTEHDIEPEHKRERERGFDNNVDEIGGNPQRIC